MVELIKDSHRDVVFNLGLTLSQQIGNILQDANSEYKNGQTKQWFFSLKGIKLLITNRLNSEEENNLEKFELLISRWFNLKQTIQVKNKTSRTIELYQSRIMKLLEKYGFLPLKKDKTDIFGQDED